MLQNGVDVKAVQEVLGHEHLNTTEIYTHIDNEALRVAAKANPLSGVKIKGRIEDSAKRRRNDPPSFCLYIICAQYMQNTVRLILITAERPPIGIAAVRRQQDLIR